MNILPGIGISKVRIRMSQQELISIYGKPDKTFHIGLTNEIRLIYNDLMITTCFSHDEKDKLYHIECANPEVYLWKRHIVGIHKDDLMQLLTEMEITKVEYQVYDFYDVIYCEDIGMEFFIEFNHVQKVSVGLIFDSAGNEIIVQNQHILNKGINDMVVYLGIGLDSFYFGLTISEIVHILGNPDKTNIDEREGFIVYYYNEKMTKFYFSSDSDRLITIEVFHPDTYLWKQHIIGMKMNEVEELLIENNISMDPIEDYDFFEVIFCEKIWSVFCFEYGRLKSLEFSVLCDEEGNYIWPSGR